MLQKRLLVICASLLLQVSESVREGLYGLLLLKRVERQLFDLLQKPHLHLAHVESAGLRHIGLGRDIRKMFVLCNYSGSTTMMLPANQE